MENRDLPVKIQRSLEELIKGLVLIYGEDLLSVSLYGSAASGEYAFGHSNVNVAIFLKDARIENVAKAARLMRKHRLITPAFFTEKFIIDSADVFPIEFLDMKENHIALYGRDLLSGIEVDIKNLRFQCEQELKSKIINIKRAYIETETIAGLRKLLFKTFVSTLHILRNVIRLKGRKPPYRKEDILSGLSKETGIDADNMRKILEARSGKAGIKDSEVEPLFFAFADELEKIAEIVDKI